MTEIKLTVQEALDIIQKVSHLPTTHLLAQRVDDALHKPVGPSPVHNGYKEIADALGLIKVPGQPGIVAAASQLRSELLSLREFCGAVLTSAKLNANDSIAQIKSVMEYRKTVTDAADKMAADSDLDGAQYIIKMNDRLNMPDSDESTRRAIAEAIGMEWMADIKTDSLVNKIEQNMVQWKRDVITRQEAEYTLRRVRELLRGMPLNSSSYISASTLAEVLKDGN